MKTEHEETAKRIIDAIWDDVHDRRGIKQAFEDCDDDVTEEIKNTWEAIILGIIE